MCRSVVVSRLSELDRQLATICKLQRMEEKLCQRKKLQLCECAHHVRRCTAYENKKKITFCNVKTCAIRKRTKCEEDKWSPTNLAEGDKKIENAHTSMDIAVDVPMRVSAQLPSDVPLASSNASTESPQIIVHAGEKVATDVSPNSRTKGAAAVPMQPSNEKFQTVQQAEHLDDDERQKSQTTTLEERMYLLKEALGKAEEEAKAALKCKDEAVASLEEYKAEIDAIRMQRDQFAEQVSKLKREVNDTMERCDALHGQCEDLKHRLRYTNEDETKMYGQVEGQVNRIRDAFKRKEDMLLEEIKQQKEMIVELAKVAKMQRGRICDLNGTCKKQRKDLREKTKALTKQDNDLRNKERALASALGRCTQLCGQIQHLQCCLSKETCLSHRLKEQVMRLKNDHESSSKIQRKIIEEQEETIRKHKQLLQESEKMMEQAACEFQRLKDELLREKRVNESLKVALECQDTRDRQHVSIECERCQNLIAQVYWSERQKKKALETAKYVVQKLCESVRESQRQFEYEKQRRRLIAMELGKVQEEMIRTKRQFEDCNRHAKC